MTTEQIQTAKEILEHHGYRVIIDSGHLAILHHSYKIVHLNHLRSEDKIFMYFFTGFYPAQQVKEELAAVYEVMIDLNLNGVPVAM